MVEIKITSVDWVTDMSDPKTKMPITYNHDKLSKRLQKGHRMVCLNGGMVICLTACENALKGYLTNKDKVYRRCVDALSKLENSKKGDCRNIFFDTDMLIEFLNEATSQELEKFGGVLTEVVSEVEIDYMRMVALEDKTLCDFMKTKLPYTLTKKYYKKTRNGFYPRTLMEKLT